MTDPAAVVARSALVDVLPLSTASPIIPGQPLMTATTPTEFRLTFRYPAPAAHTVAIREGIVPPGGVVSVGEPGETYPTLFDRSQALRRPPASGPIPAYFWTRLGSHPRFPGFPRNPGSAACPIPLRGQGRCTTELFDLSPGRRVVVLAESWSGRGVRAAAWAFVLAPGGQILRSAAVGAPPRLRR